MDGACGTKHSIGRFAILLKVLKVLKTVRLLRIFRLMKLMKTMDQWQSNPSSSRVEVIRFGRLVVFIIVLAHLAACALMFMANPSRPNILESRNRSWVTEYVYDKCMAVESKSHAESKSCAEPSTLRLYVAALYWAVSTLTTVGYGDVTPFTIQEMVWSIIVQFIGTCSLGYIMGEAYMKYRKLPHALRVRVREHYSHMWRQTTVWDEPQILDEMSGILRAEVMQYINNSKLKGMRFVRDLNNIGEEAMAQLSLRLTPQMASRGEPIIKEHQFGKDLYILSVGHSEMLFHDENIAVALESEPDIIVKIVETGDYFAEYTLFLEHEAKHPFTVKAVVPCELFSLTRDSLK
ncbi:hypothetical protein CTAYLR_006017, partial [Chrysophaeum taylorii]